MSSHVTRLNEDTEPGVEFIWSVKMAPAHTLGSFDTKACAAARLHRLHPNFEAPLTK